MTVEGNRRRVTRRWTEQDRLGLLADAGLVSTEKLAQRFRTTRKAIQQQYQVIGVSPLDNDGRYTAAELSRQTGTPAPTLIDWLRKGQLPGEKVGPYWRVEWDGISEVKPRWNGQSWREVLLMPGEKRECCAFCGNKLQKADIWCSRYCRNEHTKKLNSERRSKRW